MHPNLFSALRATEATSLIALAGVGEAIWILGYMLILWRSYKAKSPGMPAFACSVSLALTVNVGFVCPWTLPNLCPHSGLSPLHDPALWVWRACALLQAIIFWQYFRYGPQSGLPAFKRVKPATMYIVSAIVVCLCFMGEYSYMTFYNDYNVNQIDLVVNLIMSAQFITFFLILPNPRLLSYGGAWAKMIGSALIAISLVLMIQGPATREQVYPGHEGSFSFIYFLLGVTFVLDCFYILLLHLKAQAVATDQAPSN